MTAAATQDTEPVVQGKIALRVEQYLRIRDKRKALKKLFETEEKPLIEMENLLSSAILHHLNEIGAENVRTAAGTCFKTTRTTASLEDPDKFMKYVIENEAWELLDRKANTTAVKDYISDKGELPPGAKINSILTIGVHKKVGGPAD